MRDSSSGNLQKIVGPNGRSLSFTYDAGNRITSMTDNIGRVTSYTYDTSGRMITVTDPDSVSTHYTYDSSSRLATIQDRMAHTVISKSLLGQAGNFAYYAIGSGILPTWKLGVFSRIYGLLPAPGADPTCGTGDF